MRSPSKRRPKKGLEPLDWRELAEAPALRGLAEVLSTSPDAARERAAKRAEVELSVTARTSAMNPNPPAEIHVRELTSCETEHGGDPTTPKSRFPAPLDQFSSLSLASAPEAGPTLRNVGTLPETETTTVGVTTPVGFKTNGEPLAGANADMKGAATPEGVPTVAVAVTEDLTPSVGRTPSVNNEDLGASPGIHVAQAWQREGVIAESSEGTRPSEVGAPTVGATFSVVVPPTEGVTPTEGWTSSEGVTPSVDNGSLSTSPVEHQSGWQVKDNSVVVALPTEGLSPSVVETPTVVGASYQPPPAKTAQRSTDGRPSIANYYRPVGAPRTVGGTPTGAAWWADATGSTYESKRVQRVVLAQHSMSLGEERVYETLWHARENDGVVSEHKRTKTFSLGYDRIARLVRLNEKSVRALLPRLISKKILEVVASEDSANRIGRTYRIFSYEEILERQRNAALTHIVKNGRAVEFVWPVAENSPPGPPPMAATIAERPVASRMPPSRPAKAGVSQSTDDKRSVDVRPTEGETPTVITHASGMAPKPASAKSQSGNPPVLKQSHYTAQLAAKIQEVLPSFDDEALASLWSRCVQAAPDCSAEEVEYCFKLKAQQLLGRNTKATNPVGLMLWAVPKCFEGAGALHLAYREQKRAQEELQRQAEEEYQHQMNEYRRLIADPATSPEDRAFYRSLLGND